MTQPREALTAPAAAPRELLALYARPLPSSRTGPLYNAFSYPTKISPEAIALYIATHTQPGAVIMDTFAGSGTTGLAAMLCDRPTPEMVRMAAELGLQPAWGPRNAILYELGVIGSFAAQVMCNPPDPAQFEVEAAALAADAYELLAPLLAAEDDQGQSGVLRHAIWSEVLVCPKCGHEHSRWDAAVTQAPLRLRAGDELVACPACHGHSSLDCWARATEQVFDDVLGKVVERRKRVLARVYGKTGKRKWQRAPVASDHAVLAEVESRSVPASAPVAELVLGDLYRSGYHFGITHLHHLYTRRNLITMATLLELVNKRAPEVRDALRLLVLSYNQSHSTLMTRVVVKDGTTDFVLTGAQSGVLYISGLPVEKNIIEGISRKVKPLRDSFALIRGSRSQVTVRNRSSTSLVEASRSVDYCFTDPPFADFIPYAEINQVNELWLGRRTDQKKEAVMSVAQGKGLDDYGRLMGAVFREIGRVLKDDGATTVVFHAAKANVWATLQVAYRSAGLDVAATSVLDKLQASFKQIVSTVSVKGDPLLLLTKQKLSVPKARHTGEDLLRELIEQAKRTGDVTECEPERLYSRYVNRCLETGTTVDLDAGTFYAMVQTAWV
jgi:uncharacterized protein YbaR (Trm112 family)